jgi:hypothetical protein
VATEEVKVVMQAKERPYGVASKLFAEFIGVLLFVFMGRFFEVTEFI